MKKRKHLFHTVIISFLFKFIAIHNLSNLKCLLLPTLSQRRSMKNLIPGVIGGIFNDIWVPESLWGQRRLEKSPMLWNPVLHFLNLIIALCNKGWHFWKGGFVTDKTGLKIFVFINAMIFAFTTFVTNTPLYGKIASKVWKIYFQYISPHFLDAAGSQISDLWLLLLSNSSLFSALMSHLPLLLLHSAMKCK